jgi:hypothetical protein
VSKASEHIPGEFERSLKSLQIGQPDFIDFTTPATNNEEFTVKHGLGRVPFGIVPVKYNMSGYGPFTLNYVSATRTTITLSSTAGSLDVTAAVF